MNETSKLLAFFAADAPVAAHRPWPRFRLSPARWRELATALESNDWALLGLWAEPEEVHAAFYDGGAQPTVVVASLACPDGRFPSLSRARPGAIRLERTVQDMTGLKAEGLEDSRPWLDHGQFPIGAPLAAKAVPAQSRAATVYDFLPVEGEGLHQIPVGPVHAGIIEPGHFRFHANGETVVRLEERLGYVHKGIERLMQDKTPLDAAKLAARVSGDSTVAHSLAFARAIEAAVDIEAPPRANWLRALMAELERVANHLGDIGAICNDAAFVFMHSQCNILREQVMAASATCFGHRLMMDRVVPGGVACDLSGEGVQILRDLVHDIRPKFNQLIDMYDNTPSILDRTMETGIVPLHLVQKFAAGGYVGRASGRAFDARKMLPYPPYDRLAIGIPDLRRGDVAARLWVRVVEVKNSLELIEHILAELPGGPLLTPLPAGGGEGMAVVEGFRGDILTWVRIGTNGRVARCHPRDPSWFQWPLLEISIYGNIVADFPLCNKSFNCSYSGHDL